MAGNADLIDYYRETHSRRVYGTSSVKYIRYLRPWIRLRNPRSILDYGCGQSLFLDVLDIGNDVHLLRYDPAIPDFDTLPAEPADLLINIDVLEHIPEDDIDTVLSEMKTACRDAILVIDTVPAKHTLPDGRNAHLTIRPADWWQKRIENIFGHADLIRTQRRSRAAFRTYPADASERASYRRMRLAEDIRYYARRLVGRHKQHWKISSVRAEKETIPED